VRQPPNPPWSGPVNSCAVGCPRGSAARRPLMAGVRPMPRDRYRGRRAAWTTQPDSPPDAGRPLCARSTDCRHARNRAARCSSGSGHVALRPIVRLTRSVGACSMTCLLHLTVRRSSSGASRKRRTASQSPGPDLAASSRDRQPLRPVRMEGRRRCGTRQAGRRQRGRSVAERPATPDSSRRSESKWSMPMRQRSEVQAMLRQVAVHRHGEHRSAPDRGSLRSLRPVTARVRQTR
jgi:hypothetical protein